MPSARAVMISWISVLPAAIVWVSGMETRFIPPTRGQRLAAIGPTSGLPETLRRALEPAEDFQPVPGPGASYWLANHREPGQTFEGFVNSRPNRPDASRRVLYL